MKITDVETIVLRLPDLDASKCDGTQDTLIVRIRTDEGVVGIGEADSSPPVVRAAVEAGASHSIATGLRELLIGENPFETERIWEKMYQGTVYFGRGGPAMHAMSAADLALWDIVGKATGRPVCVLLGGVFRRRLKAYASALMPETIEEAVRLARRYVDEGYRAIKFGWGPIGRDPEFDEAQVRAIRQAVGDDVDLMIDAGLAWTWKEALQMAKVYERYRVFWLEEPVHSDDLAGYRELAERTSLLIAGGEQESGRRAFQRLLDEGKLDIVQPDLGRCGGLTEAKKIAYMAHDRRRRVVPHAFKTGVLLSASVHFAASIPNGWMVEYTVSSSPLARELVRHSIRLENGHVSVPTDRPGLGIELDDSVLEKYRVD